MLQDGLEGIMLTEYRLIRTMMIVSHRHSKSICTSNYICYAKIFKIIIIIIVYLLTSSDKTIHRYLEVLTSTSYTAVGSGFDLQGVPAEKPRNLLTHPPSQRVWVCWDCCCSVSIYIWDLKWCTGPLHLHIIIMAKLFLKR